jgi:serine phosphatase RsbU (regulator of sigma subunit)
MGWMQRIGSHLPRPLQSVLSRRPLAERLPEQLETDDPRLVIRPLEQGDWLCPYCVKTVNAPAWTGGAEDLLDDEIIRSHLLECLKKAPEDHLPPMRPWQELIEEVVKARLTQWPNYRVTNAEGDWICPHCLASTGVLRTNWDGTEAPLEWFLPSAIQHLRTCQEFAQTPLYPHLDLEVRATLGLHDVRKRLLKRVASDPAFHICDDTGIWLDPVTEMTVPDINLHLLPWGMAVQSKIVEHLTRPDHPGARTSWRVSKSLDDLNRLAGRISAKHSSGVAQSDAELKRLRDKVGELQATTASMHEINRDLAAARAVQIKLLPSKPPTIPGYEACAFYESCTELGGDMFHFLEVDADHTGFLIGDVSGHGVGAAMIMAGTMKSFTVRGKGQLSPKAVLAAMHRDLTVDIPPGRFVSAFYGILEHATGVVRFARAGHNPPLLFDAPTRQVHALEPPGLALGIGKPERFEEKVVEEEYVLSPGGVLMLYTDGIVEAQDAQRQLYGEERLKVTFVENSARPCRRIVDSVIASVRQYCQNVPLDDDVTLVVLRRLVE